MSDFRTTVESVFQQESGRIIASLIRIGRSFDLAEEAMQDAFAAALIHWSAKGMPDNPGAWITAAAHRKLIDYARRERTRRSHGAELHHTADVSTWDAEILDPQETFPSEDDRLRLIFTCCHPALNREAQIALTLRTLGGLSTAEIARAFLLPEPTLAQRLVRAKRKIQSARIPYEIPGPESLEQRLSAVQLVLYLVFNEGYTATSGDSLIRRELCREAIRLARTLCELMPNVPDNLGLLALMLLHDSRRDTRVNTAGELVPLDQQDRTRWDRQQIEEGLELAARALRCRELGPYQIQAAIAALHAEAREAADTDWRQIAELYIELARFQPSATVALNHAVAVALGESLEKGLELLQTVGSSGALDSYYLYHAARADLDRQGRLPRPPRRT